MTVKSRPAESLPDWAIEAPVRESSRAKWVRTGWMWGPECPVEPGHGAMVDIKTGGWYCRHQYHDIDRSQAFWSDGDLVDHAYELSLKLWEERSSSLLGESADKPEAPVGTSALVTPSSDLLNSDDGVVIPDSNDLTADSRLGDPRPE